MRTAVVLIAGLVFLAGLLFALRSRFTARQVPTGSHASRSPASSYQSLREQALHGTREALGLPAGKPAWGVLMETSFPEGTATLVCMSDGSTSLYMSRGGGIIGGGGHAGVRRAAVAFVTEASKHLEDTVTARSFPLPLEGRTVFYFLTDDGVRSADALEDDLGENRHALSPLFHRGHRVITELRAL
jgi:hypothetical protein